MHLIAFKSHDCSLAILPNICRVNEALSEHFNLFPFTISAILLYKFIYRNSKKFEISRCPAFVIEFNQSRI